MLSERKAAILQAVVEGGITTSEPVGSSQVSRAADLDVSSATIRNEMVSLEEDGYLHQPHTSAGRVPSDKGYRYFVDTLMRPAHPDAGQTQEVDEFFAQAQGELESMLRDTSAFLSELTNYAAVVVGPPPAASPMRAKQVVRLASDQAMIVVAHTNAAIERIMVQIEERISESDLDLAAAEVARAWTSPLDHLAIAPTASADDDIPATALDEALREATQRNANPEVYVGGASDVAGIIDAVEQVKDVLLVLEKQYTVVTLVKDVIDRGLSVAIGSETGIAPLAECSLVVAPIEVDGQTTGTIGVLGPTRMHYPEAMATVALVSKQLGRKLGESS
jgi:heat-inducible transcriptional repressor